MRLQVVYLTLLKHLLLMNFDKIPEPIYKELVELMGEEKAKEFIESVGYNFRAVSSMVFYLRGKRSIKEIKRMVLGWKFLSTFLSILIVVLILIFIFYILGKNNFI